MIAFTALLLAFCSAKIFENGRTEIPSDLIKVFGMQHNFISVFGGQKGDKLDFEINMAASDIYVGSKSQAKWGINCDDKNPNDCSITDDKNTLETYLYNRKMLYKKAQIRVRPVEKDDISGVDTKITLPINLIVGGQSWIIQDIGVLGLAPQSDFANYLRSLYEDINVTLSVDVNYKKETDEFISTVRPFLNATIPADDILAKFALDDKAKSWSVKGKFESHIDQAWDFSEENICLSSNGDEFLLVMDGTARCDAVKRLVCNGLIGPQCKSDKADLSKAPTFDLTLGDLKVQIKGEDYVYTDSKGVVQCNFGDLGSIRGESLCSKTAVFGLGASFLAKYPAHLHLKNDKTSELILLKKFDAPPRPNSKMLWFILGGIALGVAIFIVIACLVKKHENDESEGLYIRQ